MKNEKQFEEKLTLLDSLQSACTHCGLCSEGCATFQLTGWEQDSPRGRLQIAARFLHGHIQSTSYALSTFDRCLGCRACESLCPHHVAYHRVRQIVQELRRELQTDSLPAMQKREYHQWLTLARRISSRWWRRFGAKWLRIPAFNHQNSGSFINKKQSPRPENPVLAVCCVQDLFQHEVIEQTLSFVKRLGYELEVDKSQPCCGAIYERLVQGGEETICYPTLQKKAASLQDKARQSFLKWMPSQLYFLSQGCQSFISSPKIQELDLYAWIETLLEEQNLVLNLPLPQEVYYQPYCRQQKGVKDSILRVLQRIGGLKVREIFSPLACCGGYCGETLLHPIHAQALAQQKISALPQRATIVVASPDCWGLFKKHSSFLNTTLCYPIQILSQALIQPSCSKKEVGQSPCSQPHNQS